MRVTGIGRVMRAWRSSMPPVPRMWLVVAAATLLVGAPARGQDVRVAADPRIELLSIVFRLAGNPEYNQGRLPVYDSAIAAHFGRLGIGISELLISA
jgi:hypothetical protein